MALPENLPAEAAGASTSSTIRDLARQALVEARQLLEDTSPSWVASEAEDGVQLYERAVPGASFPMYRSELAVPAGEARWISDFASIILSSACRRYYDQTYSRTAILEYCGPGAALVSHFAKSTPVTPGTFWVAVCAVQRVPSGTRGEERVTLAMSRAPQVLADSYAEKAAQACQGEPLKHSSGQFYAVEVASLADGSVRLRMLLAMSRNLSWLPSFILKKFLAQQPVSTLSNIRRMAAAGVTPKRTIALSCDGPEQRPGTGDAGAAEPLEELSVSGRPLLVSCLLREAFA